MKQKNDHNELVANAISNLCIPYLKKCGEEIAGIYLSPFTLGDKQKIEVVITYKGETEPTINKKAVNVNDLQIFTSTKGICKYNKGENGSQDFKLSKDLKNGAIIYDPKEMLTRRKSGINKNSDITPFTNAAEFPDSIKKMIKTRLSSYNINK